MDWAKGLVGRACLQGVLGLVLTMPLVLLGAPGYASSIDKDVGGLVGEWQGQAMDGTQVHMTFAAGSGNVLMTGSWKISGGNFGGDSELSLVRAGSIYFLMPEASPYTPYTPGKEPYSLLRLPSGGLRFVRLSHVDVGNVQGVQSEEILIGKLRGDGTRTLHLLSSEKLCADPAAANGKVCGAGTAEQIVLRKVGQ
jgi:hypothetical protein